MLSGRYGRNRNTLPKNLKISYIFQNVHFLASIPPIVRPPVPHDPTHPPSGNIPPQPRALRLQSPLPFQALQPSRSYLGTLLPSRRPCCVSREPLAASKTSRECHLPALLLCLLCLWPPFLPPLTLLLPPTYPLIPLRQPWHRCSPLQLRSYIRRAKRQKTHISHFSRPAPLRPPRSPLPSCQMH